MSAPGKPMDRDISCINFAALIDYVSARLGRDAVDSLLHGLVDGDEFLIEDKYEPGRIVPVGLEHLQDPDYWVSNEFSIRFFQNASRILPGNRPLYRAGIETVLQHASLKKFSALARILPADRLLARVPRENRKYNRTKTVRIVEQGRGRAVFELRYRPGKEPTKEICEWNLGIYAGYGLVSGAKNIRLTETNCVTEGAPACIFEAVWTGLPLIKRIQGFFFYVMGPDFVEAYEKERLEKEDLVFNLEQKIEERTEDLRKSEERYRSLAANLERIVESRTKALRDSEERYRTLIENSEDVILVLQDWQIRFANAKAFQLLGYSGEEIVGKKLAGLVLPEDRGVIDRLRRDNRSGRRLGNVYDFRLVGKDGSTHRAEMTVVGCEWEGSPAVLSFLRDVTEKRELEEKVRESEALYRSLVEGSGDIIVQLDYNRVFTFVNPSGLAFFGKRQEDLVGRCLDDHVVADDLRKTRRQINMVFHGKNLVSFENRLLNAKGEIRHVSWTMNSVRGADGQVTGVQAVARDVTEAKRREEQAIQMEKLTALGEMAGGVAHDFNNILAAILGRAQLLKLYLERQAADRGVEPDVQIAEGLDIIETAASDAAETVRRIQEFTRVRSDRSFVNVNLHEVVKDVIELTRPRWKDQAESRGVKITVSESLGEVHPVLGNPSELREVLINLVVNAVNAMPEGGDILIETGTEDDTSWVSVTDTGVGMSREVQKRVFDPFFTTRGPQSSGLGLSVSYGIAKRHGGEILIKSKRHKGTTFTLKLPAAMGGSPVEEREARDRTVVPASILVVDDEEAIRKNLYDILTLEGHRVTLASGGEEGIKIFKEGEFDLVFTDLGMPEISGWQVAKAIKEINSKTPVIIITGWGATLDKQKVRESGIDLQISKPFRIHQLLELVSEGLELRKRMEEGGP
ncbi:MAG: PAS domain S-box protein [Deltaproteobacteria bacterium]|nr:PAS domain S-box protein [Deltaproteobacteria bacterium]